MVELYPNCKEPECFINKACEMLKTNSEIDKVREIRRIACERCIQRARNHEDLQKRQKEFIEKSTPKNS